ncbi:hypothetical protein LTR09_005118 [Extremus antarcticus]|uniref:FAD-binding domain-containing protein n=1 Tax=Extremus antarcticus TaxID=702011 RepID=A0AAJ0DNV0_9PEZI|nr:hypothetical protein LTR09_005118 [Extremus antarcticus]
MPAPSSGTNVNRKVLADGQMKIRVAVIGAGISGLAAANGLLQDPSLRYDVQLYERDTIAYDLERGGYQLRIGLPGLNALKTVSNEDTWNGLQKMWGGDAAKAPALVNPDTFDMCLNLSSVKLYPQGRPIPRTGLRHVLLQRPLSEERIHFGHDFDRYKLGAENAGGVTIHFHNQDSVHADILIAADGSGSKINRQAGLNNKIKLKGFTLIQARGTITAKIRDNLPRSLLDCGSVLFLGGDNISGFASVYSHPELLGRERHQPQEEDDDHTLFWSVMLPASRGQAILKKCGDDKNMILQQLIDYARHGLKLGDSLPTIFSSASSNLRTGLLTSSFKPTTDWRAGKAENSGVVLIGDAIHPMTPGRGMGANQALNDAGNLVDSLLGARFQGSVPTDDERSSLVQGFDKEMCERAFDMVKKSEQMTALDLSNSWGRAKIMVVRAMLTFIGWIVSTIEAIGLKTPQRLDSENRKI